jgi:hypothetical protein
MATNPVIIEDGNLAKWRPFALMRKTSEIRERLSNVLKTINNGTERGQTCKFPRDAIKNVKLDLRICVEALATFKNDVQGCIEAVHTEARYGYPNNVERSTGLPLRATPLEDQIRHAASVRARKSAKCT